MNSISKLASRKRIAVAIIFVLLVIAGSPAAEAREVISLDGPWEIVFDPNEVGKKEAWHLSKNFEKLPKKTINVPSCWELLEKDYEGVAFYHRTFNVPASLASDKGGLSGRVVRLHFGAVNFRAEVWLNDQKLGMHEGGFTPFSFRIDPFLKTNEANHLTLRVAGPALLKNKSVDGIGPMETPQWRGAITGGIWQPVQMIVTGETFVKDVFIEPKIADNSATFHLELEQAAKKKTPAKVELSIRAVKTPAKVVAKLTKTLELSPGTHSQSWKVKIPDAVYWSIENPHLYRAEIKVSVDEQPSDSWTARFGLREFTVRNKKFYLNNQPLFLKATFFEGLYPTKLAYPDNLAMARREIRLAKEAGFNMIRPWRKPATPVWLDLADEMGVLTVGSFVIECMDLPRASDRLQGWVENEVRESILRDRNRTCIVQWELFNELKRPILKEMLHPMSVQARKLDPTRIILDESGGWAQGANLYLPYQSQPMKFNDIHHYPGPQINATIYDKLLFTGVKTHQEMQAMGLRGQTPGRNVVPGLMTFFSELGYGSLPNLPENNKEFKRIGNPIAPPTIYHNRLAVEHRKMLRESGFDQVYPDLTQFCLDQQKIHGIANKRMIEAVRCNPLVSGYCIHALTDGDWIMGAGLLDLFRNPKTYGYEGTQAANQPQIAAIRVLPRNVYASQGTTLEVTGVNELDATRGTLSVSVESEAGKVVFRKETKINFKNGITPLFKEKLDTKSLGGTYTVKVAITDGDKSNPIAENEYAFDVFTDQWLAAPRARVAIYDPRNTLKTFLKKSGIQFVDFKPSIDKSLPVFVAQTEARTNEQKEVFKELKKFIEAGGTVVYLQGGGSKFPWAKAGKASPLLPIPAEIKAAKGNWHCFSHIVKEHPIFQGLPTNTMMGPVYENVWAMSSLILPAKVAAGQKPIAGTVSFDFAPDFDVSKRHYYGPGDAWWGADLAILPLGKGRCVLSQLRVVPNLGKDPVADRILLNLIRYLKQAE